MKKYSLLLFTVFPLRVSEERQIKVDQRKSVCSHVTYNFKPQQFWVVFTPFTSNLANYLFFIAKGHKVCRKENNRGKNEGSCFEKSLKVCQFRKNSLVVIGKIERIDFPKKAHELKV